MIELPHFLIGYLIIFGYIFLSIFIFGLLGKKEVNKNLSRKLIHISLFMVWIFIDLFFKDTIHQIIIPFSFLIINSISYKFKIFKSIEREEDNHLGTIYFAIAILIMTTTAYFVPSLFVYSGISVFCLCFGDGFASLLGSFFGKKKIYHKKSYIGFISCIIATLIGLIFFKVFRFSELSLSLIILISLLAGILELVDYGLDNFTITLIPFGLLALISNGDHMSALISIGTAIIIFFIVYFSKSITFAGALLSMLIVFMFGYFGGYLPLVFLLICYFVSFIISIIRRKIQPFQNTKKARGVIQILSNGILGTICCILSYYVNEKILIIGLISIAGCLVDSISSDVGRLSKKKPFDLIKWKEVDSGLSGGVSVLGTASSLIASICLSLLIVCFFKIDNLLMILFYSLLIFFNTIIDTILGSTIQVKYCCPVCGIITERKKHCDTKTNYHSGLKIVENNLVNIFASLITTLLAYLVLV